MAVFRGTDRIRRAAAAIQGGLRHVRSYCLKGITFVDKKMMPHIRHTVRIYRRPIAATAVALVGVAGVAVAGQQYVRAHTTDYYQVFVKGVAVGDVSSSDKVEQWLEAKAAELDRADTPVRYALDENQVTYRLERAYKKRTDDAALLASLTNRIGTHPIGVKVVVDGAVVGIVRDRATALTLLNKIKDQYAPPEAVTVQATAGKQARAQTLSLSRAAAKTAAEAPARQVASVEFLEDVDLEDVKLEGSGLSDPGELYKKLTGGSDPVLNVQSVEQVTQLETIEAGIEYQKSEDMRKGQSKVVRQGQDGQKRVTYRLVKKNGELTEEEIVSEQVLKKAVSKIILKGTKVIAGEGTGKFRWPVIGHRVTSYMGERWGRTHKGIDIVGRSSILAADNGVIEFAGYKSGTGNTIIMDHKNGFKTIYGHMKSLKVKKGQIVEKGDMIGVMGSTGNSTGTHLHFEIYLNGKLKNPTSYL